MDNMEKFFKYNLEIKKILYEAMPIETNNYNNEYIIEYSDKLFKAINDIEYYINFILNSFNFSDSDKDYFKKFIMAIKNELIKCGYNIHKLKQFYEVCFSKMDEHFVNKVGEEIKGSYLFSGVELNEAKSLNEILHLIHQTIINNENNYRNLPIIRQKQNHEENNVTLYGRESELALKIFNSIPFDLSSDFVEIMSLNNDRVVLMVRDVGHALTIEVEKEENFFYVKYFIPKICNVDMVNNLKGVKKVTDDSKYTVGVFQTTKEQLPYELNNFILSVPTDKDFIVRKKS